MKKLSLLAFGVAAMMGCGGSGGGKGDMVVVVHDLAGDDLAGGDMAVSTLTTTVSGFTVDIDKLSGYLAMNPTVTDPAMVIMNSAMRAEARAGLRDPRRRRHHVSHGQRPNAMCIFTVTVPQSQTVAHEWPATNTGTFVANTYSRDNTASTTMPVANIPAHVCTAGNMYSAPVGVAKTLAVGIDVVLGNGICMFGTQDNFTPPFVKLTPSYGHRHAGRLGRLRPHRPDHHAADLREAGELADRHLRYLQLHEHGEDDDHGERDRGLAEPEHVRAVQ